MTFLKDQIKDSFISVKRMLLKIVNAAEMQVEKYGARYVSFGSFSLINYVFPIYMWSDDNCLNTSVLLIRALAGLLNFFLLMHESWSKPLKRYLPLYWYFTVMFSQSFFASYMLCLEGLTVFWIINISLAMILSLIVLDFYSFMIVFPLGIVLAYIVLFINDTKINLIFSKDIPFQVVYLIVLSGIISIVFSRNKEKIEQEKMNALQVLGATLAHEMRTPLSTVSMICKIMNRNLAVAPEDIQQLSLNVKKIENEAKEMMVTVDMILTKINQLHTADSFEKCSMKECINTMLERYPFYDNERNLVKINCSHDFFFMGQKTAVVHILFNLMQNALYQIHSVNSGWIMLSIKKKQKYNVLQFKDTAFGIDPDIYDRLFEPMVTKKSAGTGLGLHFCKTAIESMGGEITCESEFGKYTEFSLSFPKITQI
ncbi:MAG: HAMP domain-containing histidine kinase [Holosporaceae bacterium]|jgi:signal transduction histidine kinase|nr:HAMP domain-containing histidine kinase [Holosporaceae bacterium]